MITSAGMPTNSFLLYITVSVVLVVLHSAVYDKYYLNYADWIWWKLPYSFKETFTARYQILWPIGATNTKNDVSDFWALGHPNRRRLALCHILDNLEAYEVRVPVGDKGTSIYHHLEGLEANANREIRQTVVIDSRN